MTGLLFLFLLILDFFLTALVLWIVLWALSLVGVVISFSWLLAFVVWVVIKGIRILLN